MSVVNNDNKNHLLNYEGVEQLLLKINNKFVKNDRFAESDKLGMIKAEINTDVNLEDINMPDTSGDNYPVQITTEGNAFVNIPEISGNQDLVTTTSDGLVPKADGYIGTINSSTSDWVLTKKGDVIDWYRLPSNAFNNTNTVTSRLIANCNDAIDSSTKNVNSSIISSIGGWYALGATLYIKFINGNTAVGTADNPLVLTDTRGTTKLQVYYKGSLITESNPLNIPAGTIVCFVVTIAGSSGVVGRAEVVGIYDENGNSSGDLPIATSTTVGGVKVGDTLSITDGVLDIKDYKKVTIDASSLDEDKWYPVTFKLPSTKYTKIACIVNLNALAGGVPSWSTHQRGFAVLKVWESIGQEYGVHIADSRLIYASQCTWVEKDANNKYIDPVRGVEQLSNSSNEFVYVRGGGKYHFFINDKDVAVQLHTSDYTVSSQTLYIKAMADIPDEIVCFYDRMVKHTPDTAVGNSSTPVYINQYGQAVACSSINSSGTKVINSGSTGKWYYPLHVSGLDETASYNNNVNSGFKVYVRDGTTTSLGDVTFVIGNAATDTVKAQNGYLRIHGESSRVILWGPTDTNAQEYIVKLPSEAGTLVVKNSSGTASCNISGSSGSCTGNAESASNVFINTTSTNSYYPMTFVTTTIMGNKALYIDNSTGTTSTSDGIRYNPNLNRCYCSGGFYEASDERLKNFGDDIEVDLDKLSKLSKKYFTWKKDESNTQHIGVSAQEVQAIYPELVEVIDEEGHLSVSYDKLSVIALKGIDILNDKVKSLEERLSKLEQLIENKLK